MTFVPPFLIQMDSRMYQALALACTGGSHCEEVCRPRWTELSGQCQFLTWFCLNESLPQIVINESYEPVQ